MIGNLMNNQNPFFDMRLTADTNLVDLIRTHMVNTDGRINKKHLREFIGALEVTKVLDEKFINSRNFKDALWRICTYHETTKGSDLGHTYLWNWAEINFPPDKKENFGFFHRMCDIGLLSRKAISNLKLADVIRKVIYESERGELVPKCNTNRRKQGIVVTPRSGKVL